MPVESAWGSAVSPTEEQRLQLWRSSPPVYSADARLRGPFHPHTLAHIMTAAPESPAPNQTAAQMQQVAKWSLWAIPVTFVGGVLLGRWLGKRKRKR